MDAIDKFLNLNSHKFPKGYPDMNVQKDVQLLESLLLEVGINLQELKFNTLNFAEVTKPGRNRLPKIAKKIEDKSPFDLIDGSKRVLSFIDDKFKDLFEDQNYEEIKKITGIKINKYPLFKDDNGNQFCLPDIIKNGEFGGKGQGSGTTVEDENLGLADIKLQKIIEENGGPITIKVGKTSYKDITLVKTQSGFPKSDFNLYNTSGEPVIFISHKKSNKKPSAKDFIRWSGFTEYSDQPEVKQFVEALKSYLSENNLNRIPSGVAFVKKVEDHELIGKLIYGKNFGSAFGPNNVQIIIQGEVKFNKISNGIYQLDGDHVLLNGEIPEGEYEPYFTAKYRSDRNMFGIPTNESIVMTKPNAFLATNVYELKNGKWIKVK
jgi:hypothetical protein